MATEAPERVRFADTTTPERRLPSKAEIARAYDALKLAPEAAIDLTHGVRMARTDDEPFCASFDSAPDLARPKPLS